MFLRILRVEWRVSLREREKGGGGESKVQFQGRSFEIRSRDIFVVKDALRSNEKRRDEVPSSFGTLGLVAHRLVSAGIYET